MNVIIMRGIPGSGKSTWAKAYNYHPFKTILSADDYHMVNGEYRYDPKNAGAAHADCLLQFAEWVRLVKDTMIIDNTNTTAAEIAPYYQLAVAYKLPVKIVRVCCDLQTAMKRQTHGVPDGTIWAMHQNIQNERIPAHWKEEFVWSDR